MAGMRQYKSNRSGAHCGHARRDAAILVARSRRRKREAAAEEAALARSSSGTSMDSKTFRRRPDDSAEQVLPTRLSTPSASWALL